DDPSALTAALDKYKEGLGKEVVRKIERYSTLVAQQTLLQSALEGLGRSRHRAAVEARLRHVNGQVAVLNAEIGLFMRVWLSMLVAGDDDLRSALTKAGVETDDDPLLMMALQLGGRATSLSEDDVRQRKHALTSSQLFGALTGGDLEDVALMLDQRVCVVDETILRYDQPGDAIYLVASGRFCRRIPRAEGQFVPMGDVYPGETFGLTGVLGDGEATADVVCAEPGIIYSMDRVNLLGLVHGNPEIALTLLNYLAVRVQEWGDLIQQLALPPLVDETVSRPA
ncbi:MAG: cyclic nucleotide-binding domain-containing protein, partial [Anaerolineae bacterium]|nr:cyclic nucleotide-binding domain-containing protein [Anaerolineae bacterium]